MYGFEVLGFNHVGINAGFRIESGSDIADHIFDEFWIIVGAFGNVFLIGTLEQTEEFAGGFLFDQLNNLFDPQEVVGAGRDSDVRTLVVGAVLGDFLGAGAEAGYRHNDLDRGGDLAMADIADEGDFVIHQTLHAGNRSGLVDEEGEAHFDVAGFGFELDDHVAEHGREVFDRNFTFVAVQYFHEAGHVGALEIVWQTDVHVEHGDGVLDTDRFILNLDWVANRLDAHLVDRNVARISGVLNVGNAGFSGAHVLFFN